MVTHSSLPSPDINILTISEKGIRTDPRNRSSKNSKTRALKSTPKISRCFLLKNPPCIFFNSVKTFTFPAFCNKQSYDQVIIQDEIFLQGLSESDEDL